jgi:16S rRNA (guanine966-N2)-methyltransferase
VALTNEVRIIGGSHRSRRIRFPSTLGLRPTADRVRETVFNWLRDDIEGVAILDLFAGSGAMGWESLSRGARRAVFVEANSEVARFLSETQHAMGFHGVEVKNANAEVFLAGIPRAFDVVFMDPPFHSQLLFSAAAMLEERGWLKRDALIYIESEAGLSLTALPSNWRLFKQGGTRMTQYQIYKRIAHLEGNA